MVKNIITYPLFKGFPQVKAFTTLRHTITGEDKPRFSGKSELKAMANRKKLADVLEMDTDELVFPRQTHTNSVVYLAGMPAEELQDTDAMVTNRARICLCVQTADCVPVLMFDPVKEAIGAIHAGWRGTVGLIAMEAVISLKHHFSSEPKDIRVVIGPSIGPEKYEVGNEVVEAVLNSIPNPEHTLIKNPSGKYHFNLWEANRQILMNGGILAENIEVSGYCTYSQEQQFFSARREGIETGRLVSGIMLLDD